MSDAEWLYHLTTRTVAVKLKTAGMTSALTRIGVAVANPAGAFASNRKLKEHGKFVDKLKAYLSDLLSRGATINTIQATQGQYVPFTFVPQGSNEADIPRLTLIEEQYQTTYRGLFQGLKAFDRVKKMNFRKSVEVAQTAETMLTSHRNHSLVRLAIQAVAVQYNIEEKITASHVYFLKPENAKDGYGDYKKHLGDVPMVVIRVRKASVGGLVNDDSDFRALMTKQTVGPNLLEVMERHETTPQCVGFVDLDYRCNQANWQALANWN